MGHGSAEQREGRCAASGTRASSLFVARRGWSGTGDDATPTRPIAGLGVKARYAAYVTSQYWRAPLDRIDWNAQNCGDSALNLDMGPGAAEQREKRCTAFGTRASGL